VAVVTAASAPRVRAVLRGIAALVSILAGFVACVLVVAATGGPDVPSVAIAFAFLVLGFLGVAVARTPDAPWRPVRVCLAWGSPVAAYLMCGLPFPPRGAAEWGSALTLAAFLVAALVVSLSLERRPRIAGGLLVAGGAYALLVAVRFARAIGATPGVPSGPAITISFTLAATFAFAWIAALWHARALFRGRSTAPVEGAA
jgi:hypothetical protein